MFLYKYCGRCWRLTAVALALALLMAMPALAEDSQDVVSAPAEASVGVMGPLELGGGEPYDEPEDEPEGESAPDADWGEDMPGKGPTPPDAIRFSNSMITLNVGSMLQLTPSLEPFGAQAELRWQSSDVGVATVSGKGLVTAVSEGAVQIRVSTANDLCATISLKVADPSRPSTMYVGQAGEGFGW